MRPKHLLLTGIMGLYLGLMAACGTTAQPAQPTIPPQTQRPAASTEQNQEGDLTQIQIPSNPIYIPATPVEEPPEVDISTFVVYGFNIDDLGDARGVIEDRLRGIAGLNLEALIKTNRTIESNIFAWSDGGFPFAYDPETGMIYREIDGHIVVYTLGPENIGSGNFLDLNLTLKGNELNETYQSCADDPSNCPEVPPTIYPPEPEYKSVFELIVEGDISQDSVDDWLAENNILKYQANIIYVGEGSEKNTKIELMLTPTPDAKELEQLIDNRFNLTGGANDSYSIHRPVH